jgi:hypothetical protein
MARRTRRKSRKSKSSRRRRRQSGGSGVAQHAGEVTEPVPQTGGEADIEEGIGHEGEQKGGKRKRKSKSMKGGKKKKKKTRKRKLNPFFKLMLAAKKTGAPSFKYKGKTYKGKKHHRLGMIYKKA